MSARIVGAEDARAWLQKADRGETNHLSAWAPALARTVVQQAEQIAAVLALHRAEDYDYEIQCVHCEGQVWPCATARALGVTE